jgi:hypothetical protein
MMFGDGTAGQDANLTFYEATSNAGGSAQVLDVVKTGMIYTMHGATYAAYAALTGGWTEETQATAAETFTDADNGEAGGVTIVEFRSDQLSDGFTHVRADIAANAASKIVASFWELELNCPDDPAYVQNPMV